MPIWKKVKNFIFMGIKKKLSSNIGRLESKTFLH